MAAEDDTERTEQATAKRLEKARKDGMVPRSRELTTFAMISACLGGLWLLGGDMSLRLQSLTHERLSDARIADIPAGELPAVFGWSLGQGMLAMLPMLILLLIVAALVPMAIGGWLFSAKAFGMKWDRLDPMAGIQRMVSINGLAELLKSLAKFIFIAGIGYAAISSLTGQLLSLDNQPVEQGITNSLRMYFQVLFKILAALALIAAIDVPYQLWQYSRRLRMSRQEIRDEYKELEGRPEVKIRIRQIQQEMARRRMLEAVPTADVVITNPTHYAVALRYDTDKMRAPAVVAKGVDHVAAKIREIAQAHGVVLVESPPLARALYRHTDIDQQIPSALYLATAQILAYVYQLRQLPEFARGSLHPPQPVVPEEYSVTP